VRAFLASFLALAPVHASRLVIARRDIPRALVNGRAQSWRERLNRAAFAAPSRVVFLAPDLEHVRALRERAIRCEVYAERAGTTGRASFNLENAA
jgi:hypothetical protein